CLSFPFEYIGTGSLASKTPRERSLRFPADADQFVGIGSLRDRNHGKLEDSLGDLKPMLIAPLVAMTRS
ncbi:hypothetical protein, partial [Mesorhizobium sp. M0491]|uniref:hypothetical protein n=1 Tax=Mesorhizobium sp. M0491 TaxID=2956950 RepID=UPI00333974B3